MTLPMQEDFAYHMFGNTDMDKADSVLITIDARSENVHKRHAESQSKLADVRQNRKEKESKHFESVSQILSGKQPTMAQILLIHTEMRAARQNWNSETLKILGEATEDRQVSYKLDTTSQVARNFIASRNAWEFEIMKRKQKEMKTIEESLEDIIKSIEDLKIERAKNTNAQNLHVDCQALETAIAKLTGQKVKVQETLKDKELTLIEVEREINNIRTSIGKVVILLNFQEEKCKATMLQQQTLEHSIASMKDATGDPLVSIEDEATAKKELKQMQTLKESTELEHSALEQKQEETEEKLSVLQLQNQQLQHEIQNLSKELDVPEVEDEAAVMMEKVHKQAQEQHILRKQDRKAKLATRVLTILVPIHAELKELRENLLGARERVQTEGNEIIVEIAKEWELTSKKMHQITSEAKEQIQIVCNKKEMIDKKRIAVDTVLQERKASLSTLDKQIIQILHSTKILSAMGLGVSSSGSRISKDISKNESSNFSIGKKAPLTLNPDKPSNPNIQAKILGIVRPPIKISRPSIRPPLPPRATS